jgi:glycosyltransferase involved in cell wall biosynthesis
MLGSVERKQMPALFRSAEVFLHMSQIEPFGIVYLEAAASGLAIVTHDGETPRWILGDTAIYADSNDSQAVADAIELALEPGKRKALSCAARQR